ncbi:MAG: RecQ family ATP-dependent DNA helicase [Planctomycetota bacterium]|jgi:ATP-dependent DNA helicase RecQ
MEAIDRAHTVLREQFGFPTFVGHQEAAVAAVLDGRDVLLVMPTGGGKSLAYQLPALVLDGLTLVVSPLIALMQDQVDALRRRGIRATFVNSSLSGAERLKRLQAAERGEYDLLYVTPERFRSPTFLDSLPRLGVTRLAVDEAHCVSEWGHDFRPDYWRLGRYRRELLGSIPTIACTATATPRVADEITSQLELDDPLVLKSGIDRPELFLSMRAVDTPEDKLPALIDRIERMDGPGIVYSTLIRDLEHLRDELARRGIPTLVYHGKLDPDERRRMQARFMDSERAVVLATNAFGMGVDKADIRFVLHAQIPGTIEAWTQEVGRAGRDGEPSVCETLIHAEDLAVQQNFVAWSNPDREYLLGVYETLRGWGERLQTKDVDDLRDELLVKQRGDNRVHLCLKWLEVLGVTRGSFETHDLELVRELDPRELPGFVGTDEKLRGDLEALLSLWRFVGQNDRCRRAALAEHFGLPTPAADCGACDVCTDVESWIDRGHRPRPTKGATRADGEEPEIAGFRAGDWVRVDGRHLGRVVGLTGKGNGRRLLVESVGDGRRRKVDPRRSKVERVEDH